MHTHIQEVIVCCRLWSKVCERCFIELSGFNGISIMPATVGRAAYVFIVTTVASFAARKNRSQFAGTETVALSVKLFVCNAYFI